MGVHGLTTFIARYHDKYKEKIYLHDCPIVIDGCNLMYFLYFEGRHSLPSGINGPNNRKSGGGGKSPLSKPSPLRSPHLFGGDYITYAQNVREFFQHLKHCNITPVVLYDGAYDALKIKTAFKRFAENLKENVRGGGSGSLKGVTPGTTYSPVFIKEVFVEILKEQKIAQYQTEHEADCTIAYVARKLGNCPILSSDSDFHMYVNAIVLPLPTLRFKKVTPKKGKGVQKSCPESPGGMETNASAKMWTLHSQYVSLANLCQKEFKLCDVRLLPLAAVILGNDWIQTGTFSHFHSTTAGGARVNKTVRIGYLLRWLGKQRSYTRVLSAMLSTVKESRRERITQLVNEIVGIYEGLGGEDKVWAKIVETGGINKFIKDEDISSESETIIGDLLDKLSLEDSVNAGSSGINDVSLPLDNDKTDDNVEDEECSEEESDCDELDIRNREENTEVKLTKVPEWYMESHINCSFPTYILKLIRNRMVFLSPQVETSVMPSSHTMSIPIIQVLGGILLGDEQTLTLVTRQRAQILKEDCITIGKLTYYGSLPQFNEETLNFSESLSLAERTQIILEALDLYDSDSRFENFINEWPMSLRIWIVSLLYFFRKSKQEIDWEKNEALSVVRKTAIPVGMAIMMSVIKNAVLNSSPVSGGKTGEGSSTGTKISELLVQTNSLNLSKLRQFYTKQEIMPDVSSRNFTRSYDISRAYNLSQFTCVLFHVNQLNRILGDPFRAPRLSYNLNNWFVYNFSGKIIEECGGLVSLEGEKSKEYANFVGHELVEDMSLIVDKMLNFMNI